MQERPDQATMLMAMAQFLASEVRPAVADKGLSFRVLIASAVATSLALEQNGMHEREVAEMQSLGSILGGLVPTDELSDATRRRTLREMNTVVARGLREDAFDDETVARLGSHLKRTLAARLAAINPRFDIRDQVEDT